MAGITLQTLGRKLSEVRGTRGIREVSEEIGVSPATLSRIERGNLPDLVTFGKICKWLKIDPGKVLGISAGDKGRNQQAKPLVHFRRDREICHETAKALADAILVAQNYFFNDQITYVEDSDHE